MVAIALAGTASWKPGLLAALAACAVAGDLAAASTGSAKLKVSGSFLALILAMVLLGGPPAAAIGVATILVGWLRHREAGHYLRQNLVVYAWFPLLSGLAFHAVVQAAGIERTDALFYLLVFAAFLLALALNFTLAAGYQCWLEGSPLGVKARTALVPLLPSELFSALFAVVISFVYVKIGMAAIALLIIVLAGFQHLLRELLLSQERERELRVRGGQLQNRTNQLASLQLGMISALLHTLDARDRMTARHSAAVARYSREIARAAGLSNATRSSSTPQACSTTSASSSSRTTSPRPTHRSPRRTAGSSTATPTRGPRSSRRSTATAPSPTSSSPTTSAWTARATRAGCAAMTSQSSPGSSPWPTSTT